MPKQHPAWSWNSKSSDKKTFSSTSLFGSISRQDAFDGSLGSGIKIAVLDSGVDNRHPAINGSVKGWSEPISGEGGEITFRNDPHDDLFGHGTACAGIIHNIAPDAEIYSVRVLGSRLSGKGAIFAAGLKWAIDNRMDVVNLSLGTSNKEYFSRFHELVDEAYYQNVILVTAANNMPVISFPSLYSTVISTACYEDAKESSPLDYYYNPEPPVEFGAHGTDKEVAWLDGRYVRATGNSFTAPTMSGIVALLLSKHPNLTPFEVKSVLSSLASNNLTNTASTT